MGFIRSSYDKESFTWLRSFSINKFNKIWIRDIKTSTYLTETVKIRVVNPMSWYLVRTIYTPSSLKKFSYFENKDTHGRYIKNKIILKIKFSISEKQLQNCCNGFGTAFGVPVSTWNELETVLSQNYFTVPVPTWKFQVKTVSHSGSIGTILELLEGPSRSSQFQYRYQPFRSERSFMTKIQTHPTKISVKQMVERQEPHEHSSSSESSFVVSSFSFACESAISELVMDL